MALTNLGNALQDKGQFDEAIAVFRQASRFDQDYPFAHHGLGLALLAKGQADEAIAAFRQAIRLKKDFAEAQHNLGSALGAKGQLDEAIASFRAAIRLKHDNAEAHNNLGVALRDNGQADEAIAEFREAIRLKNDYAEAHGSLGFLFRQKGQFREALEEVRRSHELSSRNPRWPYPSAQWVQQCERLVELEGKLPDILEGKTTPASQAERLALVEICLIKRFPRAAVRLYEQAFAAEPRLADDLEGSQRYNAACAAVLAGCGQGRDADKLDSGERVRLRRQALDWLNADLKAWRHSLGHEPDPLRPIVAKRMRHWLADADFAGVRGPAAIAKLPEAEQPAWRELWSRVVDLSAQVQVQVPKTKPKD
jgi:tetratricopeptide (TPR) repeat protein